MIFSLLLLLQAAPPPPPHPPAADLTRQLLTIQRLYIDKFGGGDSSSQIRDMVIASLQRTKLFVITENPDRADAVLRGSGEDLVFTDTFQTSEGVTARMGISGSNGSSSSLAGRTAGALSGSIGENDSSRIAERKHEASASIRIVNRDGDVIWSTTQESLGAKFRGASADVAEKITRQLLDDYRRAREPL